MMQQQTRETMTGTEFAELGVGAVAYTKPVDGPEGAVIGIFSADGTQVASAPDEQHAAALILQNDLTPLRVH